MHALALDERADEDRAKFFRRLLRRRETLDIHAALMPEEFLRRDARGEKGLLRFLRKHEDQIGEIVFLEHLLPRHEQPVLPALPAARRGALALALGQPRRLGLALVAMPGRDFDHARHAAPRGPRAGCARIRPTSRGKDRSRPAPVPAPPPGRARAFSRRSNTRSRAPRAAAPDASAAMRMRSAGISLLPIVEGERAAEHPGAMRRAQRLERHGVEPAAAEARGGGVEQRFWDFRFQISEFRCGGVSRASCRNLHSEI